MAQSSLPVTTQYQYQMEYSGNSREIERPRVPRSRFTSTSTRRQSDQSQAPGENGDRLTPSEEALNRERNLAERLAILRPGWTIRRSAVFHLDGVDGAYGSIELLPPVPHPVAEVIQQQQQPGSGVAEGGGQTSEAQATGSDIPPIATSQEDIGSLE